MVLNNNQIGRLQLTLEYLTTAYRLMDRNHSQERIAEELLELMGLWKTEELADISGNLKHLYNTNKPISIKTQDGL